MIVHARSVDPLSSLVYALAPSCSVEAVIVWRGAANGHRRRYLALFDAPASLTDTANAMEWKSG
ncbi:hypothetical protein GC096_16975 [Paenibacillus sp. LMG 31461]|uniref:Uncharacterized protein n=1 Tax=Paenibacillus plantarum TaxID=2654975 RepID=A0ABX1XBA5_9BACL|nr:hypothetical protein [Paenibacillus plantarum]NOU65730.1 hypothetical protein [Paenibacillus plantarum]